MTPGFEDDFAKGEQEAARLVSRMEAALRRAEDFEKAAQQDAQLRRRLTRQTQSEAAATRAAGPTGDIQRRLAEEEKINRAMRERRLLQSREQAAIAAQTTAVRRLRAVGPAAYTQGTLFGPAGGGPPQLPPPGGTGGPYYPPPGRGGQRLLGPGPPPPLQIGAGPFGGQRALPAPGQTVGGTEYLKEEAKATTGGARAYQQYERAQSAARESSVRFGRSLSDNLYIQSQANNQYARFGALSTEWIGAASRGATTIGELGRQTTATIGKFGGWLAAGSLLYTALGAVRAIGQGAIDSASGVNELQRVVTNVDPDTAQAGFRSRSERFNLPIGTVTEAAYEMGKVFHDQNDALKASDAILYSVKVGELSVADSARYLTAITRGFNLTAADTPGIFDQINAAQNRFGISISDVEAGLAKASGTFRSSGGEFSSLLAIITTAQKATGQTGQVVGTAVARAPNFLRQAANQATLRSFGINASDDIDKIIEQAFVKAQGLSGERLQVLAASIFGPQYGARVGTPLLQQFDLYKRVLKRTSPEASRGSAQQELNTLLGSMSELLSRIITELEVLGSNLAQAGFLDLFGASVKLVNELLVGVNNLLEVFNSIPAPLRHTLAIMGQIYALVLLLRKFNLGESFAAGSLGQRVFTSGNQARRLYSEGLRGQQDFLIQERERAATSAARSTIGLQVATAQQARAEAQYATLVAQHGAESEAALAQKRNVVRAQVAVNTAEERKLAAEAAELEILTAQVAVEDKKSALALARNDAEARTLAARYGDTIPGSFGKPLTGEEAARQRGYTVDRTGGGVILTPGAAGATAGAAQIAAQEPVMRNQVRGMGRAWANLARTQVSLKQPLTSYRDAQTAARLAMASTATTIGTARAALPRAGSAISRLGTGLKGLGRSAYQFLGGPVGLLLAGAYAAYEFGDDLGRALAGGQEQIDRITGSALTGNVSSAAETRAALRAYAGLTDEQLRAMQAQVGVFQATDAPEGFTSQQALNYRNLLQAQKAAIRRGDVASALKPDQLENQLDAIQQYRLGSKEFRQRFLVLLEEFKLADKEADPKAYKAAKERLVRLGARALNTGLAVTDFFSAYQSVGNRILSDRIESLSQIIGGGDAFSGDKDLRALINSTVIFGVRNLQSSSAKDRAAGIEKLQALPEALEGYGRAELDTALTLANTQQERDRAYGSYLSNLKEASNALRANFSKQRQGVRGKLQSTLADIRRLESLPGATALDPQAAHGFGVDDGSETANRIQGRIQTLKQRARRIRRTLDDLDGAQKVALDRIKAAIKEIRLERVQEKVSLYETQAEIAQARVGDDDPVAQARIAVGSAARILNILRRAGADQRDIAQAVLTLLQARNALQEAVKQQAQEMIDANANLRQAQAHGDPLLEAQAQLAAAKASLRLATTVAERKNALAELIQAQDDLDQAFADIAIARLKLREASTDDPVKQATYQVREAEIQLRNAHGAQARLEAQAQKQEALRSRRDAIAQARIEDIEFQADIGKLTVDQEIAAYQRLLQTLTLSRDARRDIRRKIHDLKQQLSDAGDFELNVGDIKLPTIYDIRRAVAGGAADRASQYSYADNSTNQYTFQVNGGNPDEVVSLIDRTVRGANRNARRSAGLVP